MGPGHASISPGHASNHAPIRPGHPPGQICFHSKPGPWCCHGYSQSLTTPPKWSSVVALPLALVLP